MVADFLHAALPWVVMGLGVALACAYFFSKKK